MKLNGEIQILLRKYAGRYLRRNLYLWPMHVVEGAGMPTVYGSKYKRTNKTRSMSTVTILVSREWVLKVLQYHKKEKKEFITQILNGDLS